jgi:HD-GYP domain-containing protein (c-di-GMP phosphodiesterase class II)
MMMFYKDYPIELLQVGCETLCTIYMLQGDNLIMLVPKQTQFSNQHLEFLRERGIDRIYVHTRESKGMEQYTAQHLDKILSDQNVPSKVKADIFYSTSSYTMEQVLEDPRTETISDMKKNIKGMLSHIISNKVVLSDLFTITAHDYYTYHHSLNVGIFATALAFKFYGDKDPDNDIERLSYGFFLHDIGKSKVPKEILTKPGKLTNEEWQIMKRHPQWGYNILMQTGHLTDEAAYIALEHHEQINGSGYPNGIKGSEIHPCARICAIIDIFDALTTERPYKPALKSFDALRYMQQHLIYGFDPSYLETFVHLLAPKQAA